MKKTLLLAGVFLLFGAPLVHAQSIDTIPSWNGTQFISSFGVPNTATYGQLITMVAGDGPLLTFSFEIGECSAQVDFRGQVFAWDSVNSRAVGPSLFQSGVQSVPAGPGFTLVTFNAGSVPLTPGVYVLMASTSQDQTVNTACRWGATANTAYAGGQFVFINNGTNTAQWTTGTWSTIANDLAFRATFVQLAPTMSTWAMIGLAALLVLFGAWTLRRRTAAA